MLPDFAYVRARTTREAIDELSEEGARLHAGGTDLLGCLHDHVFGAGKVVSLSAVEGLAGIRDSGDGGVSIGALTTITEVAESELLSRRYPGLAQAASSVASPQLRHQGTIGGNLCQRPRCWYFRGDYDCAKKGGDTCFAFDGENRYHAIFGGGPCYIVHPSDTAPALVALGASVRIEGPGGARVVPLAEFFQLPADNLPGENVLARDEIVTEVLVPPAPGVVSSYRKVRERGAWDFALTSVALALAMDGRRVTRAGVVLGGVAPIPWRAAGAEEALAGRELTREVAREAAAAAAEGAEPLEQNGFKVLLVEGAVEESLVRLARASG